MEVGQKLFSTPRLSRISFDTLFFFLVSLVTVSLRLRRVSHTDPSAVRLPSLPQTGRGGWGIGRFSVMGLSPRSRRGSSRVVGVTIRLTGPPS